MPTNTPIYPMKPPAVKERLNDVGFRAILIPFLGIVLPLITGLINGHHLSLWQLKLSFLYTIFIAFIIWQGNRYLLFTLRTYFNWFNTPVTKIIVLVSTVACYTLPVSALLLIGWYHFFANAVVNWEMVISNALIILVCVLFIVHVYETVFLVKEAENEKVLKAQMEQAKAEAELAALKNQIDPHFIFNSLNTLSHLIEAQPTKAKIFNDHLADVYRYILQNKNRHLVLLREELQFLHDYFSLLQIRFESAVQLHINLPHTAEHQYLIPPISLQVLVENAIKHNEFSTATPLTINVTMKAGELVVHNSVRKKILRKPSSKIGLENLNERYRLTTSKAITIEEAAQLFSVSLPVLNIHH